MMSSEENTTSQAVVIEEILQDPKTTRIGVVFLNRKPLEVRYYFEDKGTEGEVIMINVDSLQLIFGGSRPTAAGSFESLDKLSAFVKENIHLNKCSDYEYADCICHLLEKRMDSKSPGLEMFPASSCSLKHFHHACWSCVNVWLNEYLRVLILRRESKPRFDKAVQEIFSRVCLPVDFDQYFNEECDEFYLRIAQRCTFPEYCLDYIINIRQ